MARDEAEQPHRQLVREARELRKRLAEIEGALRAVGDDAPYERVSSVRAVSRTSSSGPRPAPSGHGLEPESGQDAPVAGAERPKPVLNGLERELRATLGGQRLANAALGGGDERYRLLFERNPLPMWIYDLGTLRFIAVNDAAVDHYGYSQDEFLSMALQDICPAEELARLEADSLQPRRLREQTKPWKHCKKDGTLIDVELISYDMGFLDQPARLVLAHDVTERKRAEESLRRRLTELEAVHAVSAALRAANTRDEALPALLDETLAALETDAGVIWLHHPECDELRVAVARSWFRRFDATPIKPGEGVVGRVFADGRTYLSALLAREPELGRADAAQVPVGWGGVCLPIRTGTSTVGVLLASVPPARPVTLDQVKVLESLAEMGGATLHRLRLYEDAARHVGQLEALHSIDTTIAASVDLRMTLQVLLENVTRHLKVDAARVLMLDPQQRVMEHAAAHGFRTRIAETCGRRAAIHAAGFPLAGGMVQANDRLEVEKIPHLAALSAREDFAAYFGVPLIAKGDVKGMLEVFHRSPFHAEASWVSFLRTLAEQAAIAIDNAQLFDNLQRSNVHLARAYDATIEGWSRALDLRDKETEGHALRVTQLTERLARAMGIGEAEIVHIRRGALLHDIGKMGVPDRILLKPDKLTDEEWEVMRRHPQLAQDLFSPIDYLQPALDIPYCHHERWDGSGYPRGLAGEQIPLAARLFAVVDVWDALTSDRPYRRAWSGQKALGHIGEQAGKQFDPRVVVAFTKILLERGLVTVRA